MQIRMNTIIVNGDLATIKFRLNSFIQLLLYGLIIFLGYNLLTSEEHRGISITTIVVSIGKLSANSLAIFDREHKTIKLKQSLFGIAIKKLLNFNEVELVSIRAHVPRGTTFSILCLRNERGKRYQIAAFITGHGDIELAQEIEEFSGVKYDGYI